MRTNIDIKDALLKNAMRLSATPTKKGTVEEALELFVRIRSQNRLRSLRGIGGWEGNLEKSRLARGEE